MSEYTPDCWVILKFVSRDGPIEKILSGWYGGYANGDSWRVSSGITNIVEDGAFFTITNESGSVYKCYKNSNRISGIIGAQLHYYESEIKKHNESHPDELVTMEVRELLP